MGIDGTLIPVFPLYTNVMYDRILVPTDGSETAAAAVEHAVRLATEYDAEIHGLYVVDTNAMSITLGPEQVDRLHQGQFEEMGELNDDANEALQVVADAAEAAGIPVTTVIRGGKPHKKIGDYIEEGGIDAVVMGSRGRSGVKRRIMGSVTERVLRSTTVPVLVIDEKGVEDDGEAPVGTPASE